MKLKRCLNGLLAVSMAVLLLTGCTSGEKNNEDRTTSETNIPTEKNGSEEDDEVTITIGMMSSSDVIPYVLMEENGISEKFGIDLELEVFTSAKDRDTAFLAGELDGVLTDFIGICIYQNADFDVRITGITDGDYILVAGADTGIENIDQIKGKSIAISENTLIDYTLDTILWNNNMESEDVVREIVPRIPDRLELLRNGKIDLGLLPEPFATLALKDGAISLGTANQFELYPAVSAFSKKALDEKENAIRNLYKGYNEAVAYMNHTDIKEYEEMVIEAVGYPEEMIGEVNVGDFRVSMLPSKEEVIAAVSWASKRGLCNKDLTYEDLTFNVYE